jgi:hypothetical protein
MDAERLTASPQTRINLTCEDGYVGVLINNRWLEMPCKRGRCRRNGVQTVHIWDLVTGQHSTTHRELPEYVKAARAERTTGCAPRKEGKQ